MIAFPSKHSSSGFRPSLVALLIVFALPVSAYVASSSNYRIEEDVIDTGGGRSTSTSYLAEDSIGESITATSSSASYAVRAGYQRMQEGYLALTVPGNITLAPAIPSVGGGTANGQATWTVLTDIPSGYTMTLRSSSSPALVSGVNSFADYVPAGGVPDHVFSVAAADSEFAMTVEGSDIPNLFLDDGAQCGVGALDTTDACWAPLLVGGRTVALRTTANHNVSGTATTIKFRATVGASHVQPSGSYSATATITVLPN